MERIRQTFKRRPVYEPLDDGSGRESTHSKDRRTRFSLAEYAIFLLLGLAMLWAWNMFLAASPYFQMRFGSSPKLLAAFPPTLLSVSTVTNLLCLLVLTYLQSNANYPKRIILSLILNIVGFTLLALSTVAFKDVSAAAYFGFVMIVVFLASITTALCQNGLFAYAPGFGLGEYTQAIMTGNAVAGVLPCIAQIVSVLSVSSSAQANDKDETAPLPQQSGKSAFAYFLTATAVSALALLSFFYLLRRQPSSTAHSHVPNKSPRSPTGHSADSDTEDEEQPSAPKTVPILYLMSKLRYLASALFLDFALTMFFPVFTQKITSTHPLPQPRFLQPSTFIPLAFLLWNSGDLIGRLMTLHPSFAKLTQYPRIVFAMSIIRVIWIPLYLLCNINDRASHDGIAMGGDFFYLVIVQLLFGLTNGYVGSLCMVGAGQWVEESERGPAGGFMGLCLVAGLSVGSLASFGVA